MKEKTLSTGDVRELNEDKTCITYYRCEIA